jgi:hypothetical protein
MMDTTNAAGRPLTLDDINPEGAPFYVSALTALDKARVPYMVGGAYAFAQYTGVTRHTKDFDIFVQRADCQRALDVLAALGHKAELTFPHWLGKAYDGDHFVDIIFGAGNGVAIVDRHWFEHATDAHIFGVAVKLIPVEEMIWSKAFIMERERFDGADVAHLLRARASQIDWARLFDRFADRWRVLYAHLVLFGFIYPDLRHLIPDGVMAALADRLRREPAHSSTGLCQGTLLSRQQYLLDLDEGLIDAREVPHGTMTKEEIAIWTDAIGKIP